MVGRGVRCVFWAFLILVGQTGCQRRAAAGDDASALNASAPSASAPLKGSAALPTLPREHRISVVATLRPGSEVRDVVVKVSSPPLEVKLAKVEASRRCGLVPVFRVERPGRPASPGRGVMLSCGPGDSIPLVVEGDRLRLGETLHELGPGPIIYPEQIQGYEAVDCSSSKGTSRPLRGIGLERRTALAPDPEGRQAFALGAVVDGQFRELARLPKTAMSCSSSQVSAGSYMKVVCELGERGTSLLLAVDAGVFWSEWQSAERGVSSVSKRFGWEVGCQHRWEFRRFVIRDPGYKAVVPSCAEACRRTHEECLGTCYRTSADDRGVLLAGPGGACVDSCDEEARRCSGRCPHASP